MVSYPAVAWADTLARFPSLVRMYPLAETSERDDPDEDLGALNGDVGSIADSASATAAVKEPTASCVDAPFSDAVMHGAQAAGTAPACDNVQHRGSGAGVTPACTPVQAGGNSRPRGTPQSAPPRAYNRPPPSAWPQPWSPDALEAAWAEAEEVRRNLAARERELLQREAAVQRAEARNRAAAKQLDELRRRLDDYGEELQEGVASLAAKQSALREERHKTIELQARARRMCAAAVRDNAISAHGTIRCP